MCRGLLILEIILDKLMVHIDHFSILVLIISGEEPHECADAQYHRFVVVAHDLAIHPVRRTDAWYQRDLFI
jgi:hypothetical protein